MLQVVVWVVVEVLVGVVVGYWQGGPLGAVWLENDTSQEHQMSAVGKWMCPASRTRGPVAHVP